ncbi:hypothetical protein RchiOBHm_Chr2g0132961 [Rosa chinensis]|uniref:Uncharacterized protein n=1 Tax=Rosa chinensis TaxID=74649 RepID=A0A2P6RVF8_ROSCH|nr:hypothetical protein RchiOBHm_Chr2g0132961 [Rosa chinensis]
MAELGGVHSLNSIQLQCTKERLQGRQKGDLQFILSLITEGRQKGSGFSLSSLKEGHHFLGSRKPPFFHHYTHLLNTFITLHHHKSSLAALTFTIPTSSRAWSKEKETSTTS